MNSKCQNKATAARKNGQDPWWVLESLPKRKLLQATRQNKHQKNATGGQEIAVSSDTGAGKGGKPITIPLSDVSPELKAILVKEMVKGGRAKVVKGKGKGKGK